MVIDPRRADDHESPIDVDRNGTPIVAVRVIPRSGRTALAGTRQGAILVRLASAPVEGAANAALIAFLADRLDLPTHQVHLVAGARSRTKRLAITGVSAAFVSNRLLTAR